MRPHRTWLVVALLTLACSENRQTSASSQTPQAASTEPGRPPNAPASSVSAVPTPPVATASASAPPASASSVTSAMPAPSADPPDAAPEALGVQLADADGKLLPQTKEKPSSDDALFKARSRALWDAIVQDKPELAAEFFFPKIAYLDVKASQRPGRDWTNRLMAHFNRDIHKYHRKLGRNRDKLTFERIKIEPARVQWIKPGREYNKIGYYRVTRSQIVFRNVHGNIAALELTSLISWRGHWYVVHLDGFQ